MAVLIVILLVLLVLGVIGTMIKGLLWLALVGLLVAGAAFALGSFKVRRWRRGSEV